MLLIIVSLTLFSSCSGNMDATVDTTETPINNSLNYEQISGEQAKHLMDTETDFIIIDARTEEEFKEGHIEGAKTFRVIGEYAADIGIKCMTFYAFLLKTGADLRKRSTLL